MSRPHKYFEVGDKCAEATILEVELHEYHQRTRYLMRCDHCGNEFWTVHRAACARLLKKKSRCKACCNRQSVEKKQQHEHTSGQVDIPGWGMTLGKLGHRHGS